VRYELGFYIPEDDILHSHRRENLKSYMNTIKFIFVINIMNNDHFIYTETRLGLQTKKTLLMRLSSDLPDPVGAYIRMKTYDP
jgi:hypothetical protein